MKKLILEVGILWGLVTFTSVTAEAGYWDLSLGFNYTRSGYANNSYSWNRRYGISSGYHFTESSSLEFSFQDNYDRNHYTGYEDSTYHDRVSSIDWVQSFAGKEELFQPYVKGGVGLLNRDANVIDGIGRSQQIQTDSITAVVGLGLRLKLTQTVGLRIEGTSYLSGGRISTWRDNFAATFGTSFYF